MYRDEDGEQSRVTLYLKTSRFARQIGEMPLKTVDGKIIYLNDLATFEYRDRLPGNYYRVNGLNTIYMNIVVDADANEIELSRQLRAKIEDLDVRRSQGETVGTGKADYAHVDVVGHPVGVRLVGPP